MQSHDYDLSQYTAKNQFDQDLAAEPAKRGCRSARCD
jgi:hypothetical protein